MSCPLTEMQTFWYRRLLLRDSSALLHEEKKASVDGAGPSSEAAAGMAVAKAGGGSESYKKLMNLLMQLRKVCNHPYMFPDSEPDFDGSTTGEDIIEGSGKLKVIVVIVGCISTVVLTISIVKRYWTGCWRSSRTRDTE